MRGIRSLGEERCSRAIRATPEREFVAPNCSPGEIPAPGRRIARSPNIRRFPERTCTHKSSIISRTLNTRTGTPSRARFANVFPWEYYYARVIFSHVPIYQKYMSVVTSMTITIICEYIQRVPIVPTLEPPWSSIYHRCLYGYAQ